jgi:hypothetical protein
MHVAVVFGLHSGIGLSGLCWCCLEKGEAPD